MSWAARSPAWRRIGIPSCRWWAKSRDGRQPFWRLPRLASLSRDEGITVILVEQNARTALSIAKDAVVLNLGRVVVAERAEVVAADTQLRHHYLGF